MNDITNATETLDPAAFAAALANEHVADIVERLNAVPPETASAVLLAMPLERAAEVLDEPGLEHAAELLVAQPVTSLIIRAVALQEVRLRDWWRVALRELPTGVMLGSILGVIGMIRIALWQNRGFSTMASTGFSSPAPSARRWSASSPSARLPDRCCPSS